MLPEIPREKQLGILQRMLMIRRAEEHVHSVQRRL